MSGPAITVEETYDLTKVLFGGVPHLVYVRRDVVGFQSWKSNACYSIEITFREGAAILTEYDERDKWEAVIKIIAEHFTQ